MTYTLTKHTKSQSTNEFRRPRASYKLCRHSLSNHMNACLRRPQPKSPAHLPPHTSTQYYTLTSMHCLSSIGSSLHASLRRTETFQSAELTTPIQSRSPLEAGSSALPQSQLYEDGKPLPGTRARDCGVFFDTELFVWRENCLCS